MAINCNGIKASKNIKSYDPTTGSDEDQCVPLTQLKEVPYRQPTAEAWVLSQVNALRCGRLGPRDYIIF